MKKKSTNIWLLLAFAFTLFTVQAQEDIEEEGSVIQTLTPSKLIGKGQYDIKWFNNLYTQTESTFTEGREARETFFTSTLEAYTGVGNNKKWNVGVILELRSNVKRDQWPLEALRFQNIEGERASGLTAFAPSIKFVPFESINNFSIQSSVFIPLVKDEVKDGVFLAQKSYRIQNRFFYDYTFPSKDWQLFAELNSEFSLGNKEDSFANNSLNLTPGVFLSYFPSSKFTILALAQHSQRIDLGNDFPQDFTAIGGGFKYQLTKKLNLETLYTNFVRGNNTGIGETFNLGLRVVL
ncbi:transporter [uncultured Nonlabens sp.]|uniref:transporter n=1 Tax=uncultured Nonlabens sp. TaxID=859306 RepID=UPI0026206C0A|nr:transporter [uncultured Nonlabens sp.]